MREAFEWHEVKPSASLASGVLSQLPKCIHNSINERMDHLFNLFILCVELLADRSNLTAI